MRKPKLLTGIGVLLTLLLSLSLFLFANYWSERSFEKECYDRILVGMAHEEARRMLGDYGYKEYPLDCMRGELMVRYERRGDTGAINTFVRNGMVSYKETHPGSRDWSA